MRMINDAPLSRSSIGFDRLLDMLEGAMAFEPADNFPPYDIEKTGENSYRLRLAVAGFTADDIAVMSQPNLLVVTGRKEREEGHEYLYRGLATRPFERRFSLADYVEVKDASLENGLLTINLAREVPDAMKPRRIAIAGTHKQAAIEDKRAA